MRAPSLLQRMCGRILFSLRMQTRLPQCLVVPSAQQMQTWLCEAAQPLHRLWCLVSPVPAQKPEAQCSLCRRQHLRSSLRKQQNFLHLYKQLSQMSLPRILLH